VPEGTVPKWSQTWYDDVKSTAAKVAVAKAFKLGGVGAFTGEGVGTGPSAVVYWAALGSIKTPKADDKPASASRRYEYQDSFKTDDIPELD
jgi:hypothetical protein